MRLFAWAHAMSPAEVVEAASRFPGLGVVLYASNYAAAPQLAVPPIAYVSSIQHARTVADMAKAGVRWHAAIINDERNVTGPSGSYMPPEQYASVYQTISQPLIEADVPVSTMGLSAKGGFWREVFRTRRFDDWYHARLPNAELRAFNPNAVRRSELERAIRKAPKWILSPAPFHGFWLGLLSPIKVRTWARYAEDERVHAVALWCLREVKWGNGKWQSEHGLLNRDGNLTDVGKEVLRVLR